MELSDKTRQWILLSIALLFPLAGSSCYHAERDLSENYKLTFMNGREVRIWRPEREVDHHPTFAVMLAGNVKQYAVRSPYITGYADTQYLDLTAEPDVRTGYFLIDTKADKILAYGMDEKQWRQELQRIAWNDPDLKRPSGWF